MKRKNTVSQEAPFAVQVEASQGCNLGCEFCGIHAIGYQKKARGTDFMSIETAQSLATQIKELGWNPRIEFAMHGEPTLHPAISTLVEVFRSTLGKGAYLMITSNGGGLLGRDVPGAVESLFDAGLNTLALDNYQSVNIVPKIVDKLLGISHDEAFPDYHIYTPRGGGRPIDIRFYPQDKTLSPHTRHRGRAILITQDISVALDGNHSMLNNHAGSAMPLNDRMKGKPCAKPFRELSVRWDGNVALCCNDWPGLYRTGNIVTDGLENVWNSDAMFAARQMLLRGRREMSPCDGCDAASYRVGLLPDKLGRKKHEYPEPDKETAKTIKLALKDGPYTSIVRPLMQRGDKK